MATLAEVEGARSELNALWAILAAEFAAEASVALSAGSATVAAGNIRDLATEFTHEYGQVAALLMAEWYEVLRPEPGFTAALATPDMESLQNNVTWSTRELFTDVPQPVVVVSRTAQVVELAAADTARMTVVTNARRDPLDVRYARYASATACAFCAMLATRQAVYRSDESAGFQAHRSCHCLAVPVWPGDEIEEPDYVAGWRDTYYDARKAAGEAGDTSAKAILAQMRRIGGMR